MKVYKKGTKIICNGYDGTIIEICTGVLNGMAVVRLTSGTTCTSISEIKRFDDEKYRAA